LTKEALKLAQEPVLDIDGHVVGKMRKPKPAQEPVAWMDADERKAFERFNETCADGEGYDVPKQMMKRLAVVGAVQHIGGGIYGITAFGNWLLDNTTTPQREWVGLTDEEIKKICDCTHGYDADERIARAVEQLLKDKNA
jgi:hypothetical protein